MRICYWQKQVAGEIGLEALCGLREGSESGEREGLDLVVWYGCNAIISIFVFACGRVFHMSRRRRQPPTVVVVVIVAA